MAHRGLIIAAAALATALVVAGGTFLLWPSTADPASARTVTVNGNITLTTTDVHYMTGTLGEECYGTSRWSGMVEGAQVTVSDPAGQVLATGQLGQGAWYDSCVFPFTVTQVPEHPVLQVEVAGQGKVPFELDQVKNGGVKLSVGP